MIAEGVSETKRMFEITPRNKNHKVIDKLWRACKRSRRSIRTESSCTMNSSYLAGEDEEWGRRYFFTYYSEFGDRRGASGVEVIFQNLITRQNLTNFGQKNHFWYLNYYLFSLNLNLVFKNFQNCFIW